MNAVNVETRRERRLVPSDGRDELNLAEFPITLLAERVPDGQKTLEFQDAVRDQKTKEIVTRKLTVSGSDKYGLPTAKDDEVILALVQLTRVANNFSEREVHFSRRDIIQLLGWPYSGQSFRRVEESLKRWLGVTLYYKKAWWNNKAQAWVDEDFHIIERLSFCDTRRGRRADGGEQQELPFSSFTWSEVIFHSFQAGYLKRLDLDFYLGLTSATAKRVYRFLDKRFYHGPRWEFDLDEVAFEHVGLSRTYHTGKIKEKLAPAVEELEAKGLLEPLALSERYFQVRRGEWRAIFIKKVPAVEEQARPAVTGALQKQLAERGVTAGTAGELVAAFPPERITAKLEVFDWMTEKKDKRLSENPAGYLVASIRGDYAAPKGFTPKAERERLRKAAEDKQRQKEEAERRKEAEEAAARQARRQHIDRTLASLTEAQRHELERRAKAAAGGLGRKYYHQDDDYSLQMRGHFLDAEVLNTYPLPASPSGGH
jgi:hypothetical protein